MDPDLVVIASSVLLGIFVWKIGVPIARAIAQRLEQPRDVRTSAIETLQRLEALQQSVEAIAVEVERISEAQRFTTKLLADRGQRAEPTR
jgi:hypothetical protein